MADFLLGDSQNVDVALAFTDAAGQPVTGVTLDPGSATATFSDGTEFTVTVSADQLSVNVRAIGPVVVGDTLTVTGSVGGTALAPGTLAFDVVAGPASSITLTPGTPVAN